MLGLFRFGRKWFRKDDALPDSYPFRSCDVAIIAVFEGLAEVVFVARPHGQMRVLTLTSEAAIELHRQLGEKLDAGVFGPRESSTRKVEAA